MISAIIAWGIGFGGVNYIPTHGFGAAVVALLPDFEIGTTENLMARYTTESQLPEYTTTSSMAKLTTDPLF